jgi:hypothetical protein
MGEQLPTVMMPGDMIFVDWHFVFSLGESAPEQRTRAPQGPP